MTNIFEPKTWRRTKEALLEGLDPKGTPYRVLNVTLENYRNHLMQQIGLLENATPGATAAAHVATLNKVILPVIRRVMPSVIANELVGVQPLTGPVGQIHTLRVRYADTVPANGSGVVAGTEALSPFEIARYYGGNQDPTNPASAPTSMLEGVPGARLSIQILKEVVEARTHKLSARWTFEAAQDAQAMHGIDLEAEIMAALAQEITAEIDQIILGNLYGLATVGTTYDQALVTGTPHFVGDAHAALAVLINRSANQIAARTRRGAGNWAVVSHTALTILQSATTSAFARTTEGTFAAPTNSKFVGVLNNSMRVYVNAYASDNTPVLVGYKGPGEVEAAAFYCPYVPLTSYGVVPDPNTFEPVVSFMTRYGYVALSDSATSLGNAADYLVSIPINTANLQFF